MGNGKGGGGWGGVGGGVMQEDEGQGEGLRVWGRSSHHFGVGEVEGDAPRDAELVELYEGIAADDCAGAEVDALAHEVASDAALLALEALADGLDGAAGLLLVDGHPGDGVVHHGRDVELHELRDLLQDVHGGAVLLLAPQLGVVADDLHEDVRDVVLGPRGAVHHDVGAHGRRRYGQDRQDEPLGARELGVEAQRDDVVVRHAPQDLVGLLGREVLAALGVPLHVLALLDRELGRDPAPLEPVLRLRGPGRRVLPHARAAPREELEAVLGVLDPEPRLVLVGVGSEQDLRRVVGDAAQHRHDGLDEAAVVHGLGELQVPEVPRAVLVVGAVGSAAAVAVQDAHAGVAEAPLHGVVLVP